MKQLVKQFDPDDFKNLKSTLRYTQAVLFVAMMIITGFTYKIIFLDEEWVTIVPPSLEEPMSISKRNPSADQLNKMGWFISESNMTFTPNTLPDQQKQVLMYVYPDFYGEMQKKQQEALDYVVKNNISQIFERRTIKYNPSNLTVVYLGTIQTFVGDKRLDPREVAYKVQFYWNNYKLYIKEAREVPLNEGTVAQ